MEMFLTIEQTAQRLQLDQTTVRRQIKRGALRAIKRGRVWRVPESALMEDSPPPSSAAPQSDDGQAEAIWRDMTGGDSQRRKVALQSLFAAPESVQSIIMQRSGEVAARFYATPEGEAELADWRALDGEEFAGFEDAA
jgi:excisionase family DNA binding protein